MMARRFEAFLATRSPLVKPSAVRRGRVLGSALLFGSRACVSAHHFMYMKYVRSRNNARAERVAMLWRERVALERSEVCMGRCDADAQPA